MTPGRPTPSDAERLRALHRAGSPLVVANAWDAASAAAFVAAGMQVIATSSGAMSQALGYADGENTPASEMFAAIARIAMAAALRDGKPSGAVITADIENGYGLSGPDLAEQLANAGAAGCNLEDSHPHTRKMISPETQAQRIAALRAAAQSQGTGLVINARVDLYVREEGTQVSTQKRLEMSIERARRYIDSGADCIFPILMTDENDIATFVKEVPGPVNIMAVNSAPGLERLKELGVARVSYGSGIHRIALAAASRAAGKLLAGQDPW